MFRPRTVLTVLGLVVAVAVAADLVILARRGLTLIAIAAFLAIALNPAVEWFQRRGLRRGGAVAAVYALAVAVIAGAVLVLVPPLVEQLSRFVAALPDLIAELTKGRGPLGFLETRYEIVERVRAATAGSTTLVRDATSALSAVRGIATSLVGIVVIAFLTLFMLLEAPEWRRRVVALAPAGGRASLVRVGAGVYRSVAGFVTGNLLASLIAAVVATATVLVAHVPYALPLGLFVGIADLVPFVGPVVATLGVACVAFTQGAETGLVVLVILSAYHLIEGHTLRPLLYGRALALSPLTVLVSLLLCSEVFGLLGALAAIPIAGTASVVLDELLNRRRHEPPAATS